MFDRLVADYDRTTTGGIVIGRSSYSNEHGKMYARKENHATCGNCKGSWPIYGTASDWMDDGYPLVKDMDRVLCPCGENFVLAAASSNAFYSEGREEAIGSNDPAAHTYTYDQQYTLKDCDGKPFAHVPYQARVGAGVVASGITDSHGRTQRVCTDDPRRLTLEIIWGD